MAQVVLDSGNLDAIVADATGEEPPKEAAKPEVKAEAETPKPEVNADDVEGEDGLTPRQKREFTKAMQQTIGKKHRMQKEAEELAAEKYREAKLAEARAAELIRENEELKAKLTPAKPQEDLKEPQRSDFKDDQSYWDAMVDYRVDKKLRAGEAERQKAEAERFQAEIASRVQAQVDRAIELVPDFKEVTEAVDTWTPTYMLEAIRDSEIFPELWYHLAKNEGELERIVKLTEGLRQGSPQFVKAAQRQLVELGKIESTLHPFAKAKDQNGEKPSLDSKNGAEPTKETPAKASDETGTAPSKPRAPVIKPLSGGSASQVERDEADLTGSQIISRWERKHGVALTARKRH